MTEAIKPPTLFILREPDRGKAELVIAHNGKSNAYPLTLEQVRLLAFQSSQLVTAWPVKEEVPFGG